MAVPARTASCTTERPPRPERPSRARDRDEKGRDPADARRDSRHRDEGGPMSTLLEPSTGDNRLPALAGEIEAAHRRCKAGVREALDAALAAGRALIEAKELVPHGQWQDWLNANVPEVSVRTAQRYMRAAEKAKSDSVSFSSLRELLQPERSR